MKILSLKAGHDGGLAYLADGQLVFSLEGEKDSFPRLEAMTPRTLLLALEQVPDLPEVVCESGWTKGWDSLEPAVATGYHGIGPESIVQADKHFLGRPVTYFSSSHERAHLMGVYGMSPFPQGQPCYVLIWEGALGDFYRIDENVNIDRLGRPLWEPGSKYCFSYHVTDPREEASLGSDWAGKVMALAAFGNDAPPDADEQRYIDRLFSRYKWLHTGRELFRDTPFFRAGIDSTRHQQLARKVSDAIFATFYRFASTNLPEGYPLLIGGGCGLNCEWNTRWKQSGLFADVFVPPCPNDSGAAIGTAVDAQFHLLGNAKIRWNVHAGLAFAMDCQPGDEYARLPLKYPQVADFLAAGNVLPWVQGRWELGPRALGNRSLLAAPFDRAMQDRLNAIKKRQAYRPVAPACLEEEVAKHFDWQGPSPYMLHFQRVKDPSLQAVTHVDGSARVQTVTEETNERFARLLRAFRARTGTGVLCNTSLNFPGRGFINTMSDLLRYQKETGLPGFVVGDWFYLDRRQQSP
jgi:predicted NodU family carbamoyl transferase